MAGRVSRSALLALAVSLAGVGQAKEQWHVYDVLGNTVVSVNADTVVAEVEATAFGESRTPTAGARFAGKPYDADLGAHVFPFRNYRSDSGRWISADPSGFPDGTNALRGTCSPISHVDPLGLWVILYEPTAPSSDAYKTGKWNSISSNSSTRYKVQKDYQYMDSGFSAQGAVINGTYAYEKSTETSVSLGAEFGMVSISASHTVTNTGSISLNFDYNSATSYAGRYDEFEYKGLIKTVKYNLYEQVMTVTADGITYSAWGFVQTLATGVTSGISYKLSGNE